ncbi:MAG: TonB-dependent receptor [Bacteroidales bacterium]|nr:TonB-dependent receptor [Bacteroidales bacterium]
MKRILTILTAITLSAVMSVSAFAQNGRYVVKGVIVDELGPVAGAAVVEQGTTNGAVSDLDGNYSLTVSSADAIIEIRMIGYATQTFKASDVPATVTLAEDAEFLDEVVVIGYGTVKKSDLTGSVSTVRGDDINKGVITTPADLLRGKTAGVVVTQGNGMPGSGATIRIRGGASLNASNDPLYIIDGLPVSNDGISGMSDPLSSINPEDIESFTVLKDASATAIYGSRASNGVIVITTKKGTKNGSAVPQISIDVTSSLNTLAKYQEVLTGDQLRDLIAKRVASGKTSAAALGALGKENTDWQKQIYHMAPTIDANLSLNGYASMGDVNLPYRVSGGYINQNGTLKGSKMDSGTAGVNLSPSFLQNHLTVNLNGKYTYAKNWYADQGAIGAALRYDPTQPIYATDAEGGLRGYRIWRGTDGNPNGMATLNPVAQLNDKQDYATANRFIGNAQFDYKIHGFEDLRLNLNLGIDWAKSSGVTEVAQNSELSYHNTSHQYSDAEGRQLASGSHTDYHYGRQNTTLEFYADYNKTFGKHNVDLMAGYSWQRFYTDSDSKETRLNNGTTIKESIYKGEYFLISFFGRANYSFGDKYLITATVRRDGTSRFQNNKWGLFPSVALGWNVKNEDFMKGVSAVSTLKLRASWGQTGQQDVGGYYDTFAKFYTNQIGSYYQFAGNTIVPITALGYNADLKWETTTTYNIGLDLGFWNDRLTATVDVYQRDTKDLLSWVQVAALSNLTNYLNTNIASLTNKGVELDLRGILIDTKDMSWTAGFNMAYNYNEITKLNASSENKEGVRTGSISGGTDNWVQKHDIGHPMNAFYVYQQVYDQNGKPVFGQYVDQNNDGVINESDRHFFHKPAPDFTFGFNTSFMYKNWTAALSGHASVGNYVYNNVASNNEMYKDLWVNNFVSNRNASALYSDFDDAMYISDYYIENGSFLKLDNFTLGYTFPRLFEMVPGRNATLNIFGTVQNICTLTKYSGIDPEVNNPGAPGIDGTVYPRPRTYVLGLKFNF